MADNWEEEDWEKEDFVPQLPSATKPAADYETKGQAVLASIAEPDPSKFQDEDKEESPPPTASVAKTQKKEKKETKKGSVDDVPLDDPVAEKARQQRLIEEADYKATKDLFAGAEKALDEWLPKSVKDFEDFAKAIADRHITPHADNKNFKSFLKSLVKLACEPLTSQEIKDVETSLAGLRAEKHKAEVAAASATKAKGSKKFLNVGKGGATAGLDDYLEDAGPGVDDDYDFM